MGVFNLVVEGISIQISRRALFGNYLVLALGVSAVSVQPALGLAAFA
jgi:hypothetical protein